MIKRSEGDPLQRDAEDLQHHEGHAQHEGDRDGDDEAGPETQADETHRQDDDHRLNQRVNEAADGFLHHFRLVRHEVHADPDGERGSRSPACGSSGPRRT